MGKVSERSISKEDLKMLIERFIQESIEENTLETRPYKFFYRGLKIDVSFGKGQQSRVSWFALLEKNQKVSKGIYPVILFNRQNCLVLAYGVSEKQSPEKNWGEEIESKYNKIETTECECDLSIIKKKYPNSYLRKCFVLENNKLDNNHLEELINFLDEIIDHYHKVLSGYSNTEKTKGIAVGRPVGNYTSSNNKKCFYTNTSLKLENHLICSFYNSLKTKGFVILAGLSGTGKTKIFEEFVKCFPSSEYKEEKWVVIKETGEKLFPIYKEEIEFNNGKIKIEEFIDSINDALHEKTHRRVYLKLGSYYAEVVPVVENLKKRTSLISAEEINNHLAVYIASLFGFEIVEREDIEKLNLKRLNKKLELIRFSRKENSLFFPIRPDYKDSKSLLGFYNPINNKYHSTPLLDFILDAVNNYLEKGKDADPFFVLFDEMNLARVEYYFADFLSILEAKRFESKEEALGNYGFYCNFLKKLGKELTDENYRFTSQSIKLHTEGALNIPQEIFLPPNLYFVGTVNIDETTHMFSPKVLDRAFIIEFDVESFESYVGFLKDKYGNNTTKEDNKNREIPDNIKRIIKEDFTNNGEFAFINKEKITEFITKEENNKYKEKLEEINRVLKPYNLHFGYRVFDEIIMFMYNCQNSIFTFDNLEQAFDLAIKMKVLPKFHGTRQKLERPIIKFLELLGISEDEAKRFTEEGIPSVDELDKNIQKNNIKYKHTVCKLLEMLYKLKTEGFASFM